MGHKATVLYRSHKIVFLTSSWKRNRSYCKAYRYGYEVKSKSNETVRITEKRYKLQTKVFFNNCLYGHFLILCKCSYLYLSSGGNGEALCACYPADPSQCAHEAVLEVLDAWHLSILVLISRPAKELLDFMNKEAENRFNMLFRKTRCKFFGKKVKPNFNLWEKNSWRVILRMIYFKILRWAVLCMCLLSCKN